MSNQGTLNTQNALNNLTGGQLTNAADHTLTNSGTLTNEGQLDNSGTLSNQGTLDNQNALNILTGGRLINAANHTLTNTGTLTNQGQLDNSGTLSNQGTLDNQNALNILTGGRLTNAANHTLTNTGTLTNQGQLDNRGTFVNSVGSTFNNSGTFNNFDRYSNQGVLNNTGTLNNAGQLTLATTGLITGLGSLNNTALGTIELTGAGQHVIAGNLTNNGIFKTTDTSVVFTGNFNNNARYESDPSTNQFNNLSISQSGYLVGGAGDTFIVTGDFNNASSQNTLWNTTSADLVFSGPAGTSHTFGLAGEDKGITTQGAIDNFAWSSMTLSSGNSLTMVDGNNTAGAALYASRVIMPNGLSQLANISSNYNVYFDPTLAANQYLLGTPRTFGSGVGRLMPWNLVPFGSDMIEDRSLTPNQQGFAAALAEACSAPVGVLITRCMEIQALSPTQQKAAIASLTPDQVPGQMLGPIKFSATRMEAPFARLASLRNQGGSAPLSFNFNGMQIPVGKLGGAAGDDDELFRDNPLSFFLQTRFNFGDLQNNIWERGFESRSRAVTVGADYRFNDQLVTGLAFNYTNQSTEYVQSAGRMNTDSFMGAFYGSYFLPQDFYLDWVANYGSNEYDFTRQYSYPGFKSQSNANPEGYQYSFAVSSGKDFSWQAWSFNPYVRFEYLNMHIDQYQEQSGNGFDMTTGQQDNDSFISNVGLQISHALSMSWGVVTPALRVEWEHQYLNDNRAISMRLSQAATGLGNFVIQTGEPDRDYINLGGSVSATLPNGGAGFVRYETRLGQTNISEHIVEAGVRFSF